MISKLIVGIFWGNVILKNVHYTYPKKKFPIINEKFFGKKIKLPACKKILCEWLYGESWRPTRKKHVGYEMRIIRTQPMLIKRIPRALEWFIPKPFRPLIERQINKWKFIYWIKSKVLRMVILKNRFLICLWVKYVGKTIPFNLILANSPV